MRPTRRTQPYRKGARQPGKTLDAMKRGRDIQGNNPADIRRATAKKRRGISSLLSSPRRTLRR